MALRKRASSIIVTSSSPIGFTRFLRNFMRLPCIGIQKVLNAADSVERSVRGVEKIKA